VKEIDREREGERERAAYLVLLVDASSIFIIDGIIAVGGWFRVEKEGKQG